jgi:hypothetical protein
MSDISVRPDWSSLYSRFLNAWNNPDHNHSLPTTLFKDFEIALASGSRHPPIFTAVSFLIQALDPNSRTNSFYSFFACFHPYISRFLPDGSHDALLSHITSHSGQDPSNLRDFLRRTQIPFPVTFLGGFFKPTFSMISSQKFRLEIRPFLSHPLPVSNVTVIFHPTLEIEFTPNDSWLNDVRIYDFEIKIPSPVTTIRTESVRFNLSPQLTFTVTFSNDDIVAIRHFPFHEIKLSLHDQIQHSYPPFALAGVSFPLSFKSIHSDTISVRINAQWTGIEGSPVVSTDTVPATIFLPPLTPGEHRFFIQIPPLPEKWHKVLVQPPFNTTISDNLGKIPAIVGRPFVCEIRAELAVELPIVVQSVLIVGNKNIDVQVCEVDCPFRVELGEAFSLIALLTPLFDDQKNEARGKFHVKYTAEPLFFGEFEWTIELSECSIRRGTVEVKIETPSWCNIGEENEVRILIQELAEQKQQIAVEIEDKGEEFLILGFMKRTFVINPGMKEVCSMKFIPLKAGERKLPEIRVLKEGMKVWSAAPVLFVM